jgi:type I restriction enzyme S subunit
MVRQTYSTYFPVEPLGNLIEGFEGGVNFPPVPEGEPASEWRVLKISAVTWGEFNPPESKPISPNVTFDDSLIVRQGDLIMSRANTTELVGSVVLARTPPPKVLLPDKLWRIKFPKNSKLLPEYALLALRSPELRRIIGDLATGTSGSMKNISMEKAATLPIPLPPLAEQKRIAAIAQKADRLRRTRRYALQLSDTYLQSVFLEMFGDPGTNPKGWRIITVDSLFPKERQGTQCGPFGSLLKKHEYVQSGIPVWGIDNVKHNKFVEENSLFITKEKYEQLKNYSVIPGDILISRAGTTGRMCIARPKQSRSIIGTNLIKVSLDTTKILPDYFVALFSYFQYRFAHLRASSDEGAYSFINTTVLKSLRIPLPPLLLQEKFAQIVQKFERLRTQQREAERQAEHLLQTLLHRAFRGELTPQDANDEPASVLLEEIGAEQAQAEAEAKAATQAMGDAAEYLGTRTKQQDTKSIQLTLPGIE